MVWGLVRLVWFGEATQAPGLLSLSDNFSVKPEAENLRVKILSFWRDFQGSLTPGSQDGLGCVASSAGPGQTSSDGVKLKQTVARSLVPSTLLGPPVLQSSCLASSALGVCSASKAPSLTSPSGRASSGMWGPCCALPPLQGRLETYLQPSVSVPYLQQQPVWGEMDFLLLLELFHFV